MERIDDIEKESKMVLLECLCDNIVRLRGHHHFIDSFIHTIEKYLPLHRPIDEGSNTITENVKLQIESESEYRNISDEDLNLLEPLLSKVVSTIDSLLEFSIDSIQLNRLLFRVFHTIASFNVYKPLQEESSHIHTLLTFLYDLSSQLTKICIKNSLFDKTILLRFNDNIDEYDKHNWSKEGIAMFILETLRLYHQKNEELSWIPLILSKEYLFALLIPHISNLLKSNYSVGLEMLLLSFQLIPDDFKIDCDRNLIDIQRNYMGEGLPDEIHTLIQSLIDISVRFSDKNIRRDCYMFFKRLFYLFKDDERYLLSLIIIKSCPYTTIVSATVRFVKDDVLNAYSMHEKDRSFKSIFISNRLFKEMLSEYLLKPTEISQIHDILITTLNLLIGILIRDSKSKLLGIWKEKDKFRENVIKPLDFEITRHITEDLKESETYEDQVKLLKKVKRDINANMTHNQLHDAQQKSILSMQLLHITLTRVEELLK